MKERKAPAAPPLTAADKIGNAIDRVIYAVAPERGLKRMAMRKVYAQHQVRMAHVDAGESTKTRDESWLGSRLSTDSALEQDLATIREKSRELYRTDSIGGAVESRANLTVSYGFTPQARIKERAGLVTAKQAKQWNDEIEEVYERIYPVVGKNGKQSLWQLLRLGEKHLGFDGEMLTILSDRGEADKPIPLTLEMVDPMRLETPPEQIGNKRCRLGVEYDASGKIKYYHIRDSHPQDSLDVSMSYTRYDADRVLHVFDPWFAGQSRGYPWLTRAITRCKDSKDLDEAAIIAAQVEACHAAFVKAAPGVNPYTEATNRATGTSGNKRLQEILPGKIDYLQDGEEIIFSTPTRTSGYDGIQGWNWRRIAAAMSWPYEMLVKNWSGTSFAGGRLVLSEAKLFTQVEQKLLIENWLSKVWQRMVFEAVLVGAVSIPSMAYNRAPWMFNRHEWRSPVWPFSINPGEEIRAMVEAVNNNLRTKASAIGEMGGDLEEVFAERQRERDAERDMKIEPAQSEVPSEELTAEALSRVAA